MNDKQYQNLVRQAPCIFTGEQREGMVSWHHLLCIHQSGKGMKPPSWATIPVSDEAHKRCHDYSIDRRYQKKALMETWMEIGEDAVGVEQFWKQMGEAYWRIIGGDE